LGLVKLEPRDAMQITAASFADPDSVHLAQLLIAFGGPFAPSASVSVAHVGALHRRLGIEKYEDFIQVDQTVAAASTGGPLFDNQGKLVGILSSAKPASGSFDGVGFAVSAMLCQAVGNGLLHYSKVPRSYLGIRTQALTSTDLQTYGVKNGIKVAEMPQADNPAVRAGVRIGDIVVSVDGKAVSDPYQSYLYITHLLPFHTVTLNVARDHANLVFYPELWELPDNDASAPPPPNTGQPPPVQQPGQNNPPPVTPPEPLSQYVAGLGVWVVPVTDAIAFRYGFARGTVPSQGLVITNVQAGSRADVPDLVQIGMVIVKAGDKAVATVDDLIGATPESDGGLLLQLVHPDGQVRYVELQ
jgi:S1-C subfamily serine protease